MTLGFLSAFIIGLLVLAYLRAPAWAAAALSAAGLMATSLATIAWPVTGLMAISAIAFAIMAIHPLRRAVISAPLFSWFKTVLPAMSATEKEALDAGTVWWDAELFSGRPDWKKLFDMPPPALTREEQDFIDGPVEELCSMLDEWKINRELKDLPPEAWQFIREKRFLSMIIPKEYGGLEFTAQGNAAVVTKISTRSLTAAVSVMVPNSLGPGELLMHFGTEDQKKHYLPRLSCGEEIPCFALTSPQAGSDAASMPDEGVVCKKVINGEEVLGLSVTWDKRYITLAPVATVLGLAFKTRDPDGLLGGKEH
ncbi:MAG TPA: acyl-CoA dehydrogenase family protein, partial [Wenzhouxiangella sp.]|nr:acyl-CoA dehydrogenase family protein [Wenzhouxiangella sp.]